MGKREVKFRREPIGVTELRIHLTKWLETSVIRCHEGGLWEGRWNSKQQSRGADLLRHWWSRGLMAQAWDKGYLAMSEGTQVGDNPYRYAPDWHRRFRSVAACFDRPRFDNPFRGAKRRQE